MYPVALGIICILFSFLLYLRHFLFHSPSLKKYPFPFKEPGYGHNIKLLWKRLWLCFFRRRRKIFNQVNLDYKSRNFGNRPTELQKILESPISLTPNQSLDEVRFTAVNVDNGSFLDVCVARRSAEVGECWFYFQVKSDGQLKAFTLPKTRYNLSKTNDSCWAVNDIKIVCIEPLEKWRISYNGLLREMNTGEINHIKFSFIWKPFSTTRDHQYEISNYSLAEAQVNSCNYDKKKVAAILDQYDQWGVLYGTYNIDNQVEKELYLRGNKSRFIGNFDWSSVHRFIQVKVLVDDGRTVSFNVVSFNEDMPLMTWGYIDSSIGVEYSITRTDFCFERFNEFKQLPEIISIRIFTDGDEYVLELAVEQVNGIECMWGNSNNIIVNSNRIDTILTNISQGYSAKGMGSSHFYHNSYSVSNENTSNKVVEKYLEFSVTGENFKADIVSFSEHACGDDKLTGGKGSSLALLKSISGDNFDVPGGFCITVIGNRKHINDFKSLKIAIDVLTKKCSEGNLKDIQDQCERIGSLFKESKLSPKLKNQIISCLKEQFGDNNEQMKFAVRSSAIGEDGAEISGAGQMETFLGCFGYEMIFKAVKKCWASCFSFKAVEYRRQYGQIIDVGMCVVVQKMVAADVAGVMFTRDPMTGNPGVINISANFGLGESVVSASSDPDNITVNRDPEDKLTINKIEIGKKGSQIVMKDDGNVEEIENKRTDCCLTHNQALKLAKIGIQIESSYGNPRDIEWAIKENRLFLLQARPITSLDNMSDFELEHEFDTPLLTDKAMLTSGNIREVMPGALSPLTHSLILNQLSVGLCLLRRIFSPHLHFHPTYVRTNVTWRWSRFMDRIEVYYNNNEKNSSIASQNFRKGFDFAFNGRPIEDDSIKEVGVRRYGYASYLTSLKSKISVMLSVLRTEKYLKEMKNVLGNFKLSSSSCQDSEKLWNYITTNTGFLSESVNKHIIITLSSVISNTQVFVQLLGSDPEFTDKHYADFANLMSVDSSTEHVESADVPSALKMLAKEISKHIEVEKCLSMSNEELLDWVTRKNSLVADNFKIFLDKHGHRSSREFDVMYKTWDMDPIQLMSPLKACLSPKSQNQPPKKSLDKVLNLLKCNLTSAQKKSLRKSVLKSREFVAFREQAKSLMIRTIHQYRKEVWKLARLMVKEGRIPNPELLMCMTCTEISNLLKTRSSAIIQRAIRRRRMLSKLDQVVYPEIIIGLPKSANKTVVALEGCFTLQGTAVSQGTAKGIARVITNVQDAEKIEPGDILVTFATDIAWSPYFPGLSGVVTEIGGLVSHGAVVAREYGIPCVVGVLNATSIFTSGDVIYLDGTNGQVSKIERE